MSDRDGSQTPPPTGATEAPILDLATCDREPVQFPGAIMPHGILVLLDPADLRIRGCSANAGERLGRDIGGLLGAGLDALLAADAREEIEAGLAGIAEPGPPQYLGCHPVLAGAERFDCFAHRSGEHLVLELEAIPAAAAEVWPTARLAELTEAIGALRGAATWREGMTIAVRELRRVCGFESVQGVRFMPDGSGLVVAECQDDAYPSFLDLRFPRSDMPEPARRQMALMPVQYAPDLAYDPVPVRMADQGGDPRQLDLGLSVLRSSSVMCNRFYLNLGTQARLVLTILDRGELWGFFTCRHSSPRPVPYADRLAYQTFAEMVGLLLVEKQAAEQQALGLEAKRRIGALVADLNAPGAYAAVLGQIPARLIDGLDLEGAALCLGSRIIRAGRTPPESFVSALLPWLDEQSELFATDRLPTHFPAAADQGACATGLIAARLRGAGEYLLGFRPEWVHEVHWAGDPSKPVEIDLTSGEQRLTPRGSFEVWRQDVHGLARPWLAHETESLMDLQRALVLVQHTEQQRELRVQLERSNAELEAFAYVISHDLQEPLRGIRNFAYMLEDDLGERLEAQERGWLETIQRLTVRMTDQIGVLLQYSRAGRQPLELREVDLGELLQSVLEALSGRIHETGAEVRVAPGMPTLACDPSRTAAVFENLIANGIKYNDRADKRIDVGVLPGAVSTFFVRDNGIGIQARHKEAIFTIFRRLHGRDDYGGGTGAGLTIAKQAVQLHGGRIWLESAQGQGTVFYFTLAPDPVDGAMADG